MGKRPSWDGWRLPAALGIRQGEVAAFVGGGGKTTAMFKLAADLTAVGWRIITCTTTHLGREQSSLAPCHLAWETNTTFAKLSMALQDHAQVLVTGPPTENGLKWEGVSTDWVAQAASLPGVDAVLVEADGARHLAFKAPAEHEPAIPSCTTLLVPMMGIDALNHPLNQVCHRPERASALTGLSMDDLLTPLAAAKVLAHPQGGLKNRPAAARVRVLINKVETQTKLAAARKIAHQTLQESGPEIEAVIIGALQTPRPSIEVRRRVTAVVLAAGRSLRMGGDTPKQLLPWGRTTVVRQVINTLSACPGISRPILVITGAHAGQVRYALQGAPVHCLFNRDHATGEMISSLQTAIPELPGKVDACLVALADQPWLEPAVIKAILNAYAANPAGIVAPTFGEKRGHPVLFDRRHWPELLQISAAPRQILQGHQDDLLLVPVTSDSILRDLDTPDDYRLARQQFSQ